MTTDDNTDELTNMNPSNTLTNTSTLNISLSSTLDNQKKHENLYKLIGIVVHSGQANSGHYYSFIKDRRHCKGLVCVFFLIACRYVFIYVCEEMRNLLQIYSLEFKY